MTRKKFVNHCMDFIMLAAKLNEKRVRFGLEALAEEIEDLECEFFKCGLRLAVDGTDPAIIDEILSNKIVFEKCTYARRYRTMQKRTVLALCEGLSTRLLVLILLSLADLPQKELHKAEYELLKDPPCYVDNEPNSEAEGEKYRFTSKRQYAMARENIEYAGLTQGIVYNPAGCEIIITPDCENREKVVAMLADGFENGDCTEHLDLEA